MTVLSSQEADQFARYEKQVHTYSRTWFNEPVEPQRTLVRSQPELLEQLRALALERDVTTADAYFRAERWKHEREDPHHRGALENLEGVTTASVPRHCYFLLGVPGSGKTRTLRRIAEKHARAAFTAAGPEGEDLPIHLVDADAIRTAIPEYAQGLGSSILQQEVVHLTYEEDHECVVPGPQRQVIAAEPGQAIAMYDIIGSRDYLPQSVTAMKDLGWSVFVLCTKCPTQTALTRAARRALESGRYVDPSVIRDAGSRPQQALSSVKKLADGWALVDTSGAEPAEATINAGDGSFGATGTRPLD